MESYCLRLKELEKMEIKSGWTFLLLLLLFVLRWWLWLCVCSAWNQRTGRGYMRPAFLSFLFQNERERGPLRRHRHRERETENTQEISFIQNRSRYNYFLIGNLVSFYSVFYPTLSVCLSLLLSSFGTSFYYYFSLPMLSPYCLFKLLDLLLYPVNWYFLL